MSMPNMITITVLNYLLTRVILILKIQRNQDLVKCIVGKNYYV